MLPQFYCRIDRSSIFLASNHAEKMLVWELEPTV